MNRRTFLRSSLSALVGAAIVPRIPFPTPVMAAAPTLDALNLLTLRVLNADIIRDNFFRASPLYDYFRRAGMIQINGGGEGINLPYNYYEKK